MGAAPIDPKTVATEAYTFGYPLVLMDVTRAAAGASNRFAHAVALPDPSERQVVRLNLDTLYSQAWLDLRAEPLVLQVPEIAADRYWLMQIMDAWSNTRHNPSSVRPQAGFDAPYTYLLTGPDWAGAVPDGMARLAMPTATAWILGRIQVDGEPDVAAVRALQEQLKLVPLSAWLRGETASPGGAYVADTAATPPPQVVAAMSGTAFFDRLCALMADNPPAPEDAAALERFAAIGIAPGARVDPASAALFDDAAAQALSQFPTYLGPGARNDNGWLFSTELGTYGTDYALRARTALQGLGANLAEDSIYPTTFANAGEPGASIRYRLRFPAGQLPPVAAFWSLTAYDADSYLVPNTAGVYAIGHGRPVVPEPDGSVVIAVQAEEPGPEVPQANWLPIPAAGPFSLSLRLYAPEPAALNGGWHVPALTPAN